MSAQWRDGENRAGGPQRRRLLCPPGPLWSLASDFVRRDSRRNSPHLMRSPGVSGRWQVKIPPRHTCNVTESALSRVWRPPLQPCWRVVPDGFKSVGDGASRWDVICGRVSGTRSPPSSPPLWRPRRHQAPTASTTRKGGLGNVQRRGPPPQTVEGARDRADAPGRGRVRGRAGRAGG
jgi:hypothetical protein